MPRRSTSQQVPKELQARFDEITQLTDAFSQTYLNGSVRTQFQRRCTSTSLVSLATLNRVRETGMTCPHCASTIILELMKRTHLGYRIFRCSSCQR
jgi:transposase-like protein